MVVDFDPCDEELDILLLQFSWGLEGNLSWLAMRRTRGRTLLVREDVAPEGAAYGCLSVEPSPNYGLLGLLRFNLFELELS